MSIAWRGNSTFLPYKLDADDICAYCRTDIFNYNLYQALLSARPEDPVKVVYIRSCSDLYSSFCIKCPWCSAIVKAIVFTAETVNFMNSDDDDADQDYGKLSATNLACEAVAKLTVWLRKRPGRTTFDTVEIQIEVINSDSKNCELPEMKGGDSIFLEFELSSNVLEPHLFQSHWGRLSADSDDWLAPALSWLHLCDSHSYCKQTREFCLSRLIDVTEPRRPRLRNRGEIQGSNGYIYATLSYVWGPAQTYVLETANQNRLRIGLDPTQLPQTIQDAIEVASRLQIKYIWVDALCIIQDSPNDKAMELPQMARIYRSSMLTIFAASAACSGEGFLKPPEGLHSYFAPISIPLDTRDDQRFTILLGTTQNPSPGNNPIYSRAWTLQEQLLSSRLLIFEYGGVSWECSENQITYQGPVARDKIPFLPLCKVGSKASGGSVYSCWQQIRSDYCGRNLSFLGDKLNAISAIASEISRTQGWTYLAGLWKEHLIDDLLWAYLNPKSFWERDPTDYPILKSTRARTAKFLAPSWSWASVAEGSVQSTDIGEERLPFDFEVLDWRVETADAGPFGAVKSGFLEVKGKAVNLKFRPDFGPEMMDIADIALLVGANTEPLEALGDDAVGYGATDPLDAPLPSNTSLLCLAVAKEVIFKKEIIDGLMLLPNGSGTFRRVGFFRVHQHYIFHSVARQVLKIE